MIYARVRDRLARASFTKHLRMRGFMARRRFAAISFAPFRLLSPPPSSLPLFLSSVDALPVGASDRGGSQPAGKCVVEYHGGSEKRLAAQLFEESCTHGESVPAY